MIDAVEFKKAVESYYNDFTQRYWDEEEGFKWKAVKAFSEKWDIDSSDFSAMLKAALKEAKPLLMVPNYFSSGMIGEFADAEPETVRQMFRDLYDESADLLWRFDNFKKQSIKLLSIIGKADKNHYQDEHAISIYLWLRYPAKYYIYKFTETQNMAELLKSQYKFVSGHYTEILSNWLPFYDEVTELLRHEDALLQKVKGYITDDSYADESLHTLTSDFAFYITRHYLKAQEKNAWWPSNYTPAISESQWLSLLSDNDIFDDSSRTLIKQFADIGGQATCTELAKKYGGKAYVVQMFESTEYRCYAWLDMRPEYGYKDIGSVYGKPNPYKPLPVSNYNHTVRFLLGFLYFYDVDLTPGYQSRYAWNEARKVAYLADIFAGKDAGEIVFQEIPSSDPMPKYQLIKGEQEAITLREFYENRLLYKKACYNDIRADDIFWFRQTMLRMIVYNAKHEPSTEHEDIAIIGRILFGRY